jgi:Protein kinase domain
MQLSRTSSSSSTELAAPALGDELAGFRLERLIGHGRESLVFEATQVSLDRRVALKVLPERPAGDRLRWPENRHVVSLYAAGPCEYGYFVAMQLIRGTSLAELLESRRVRREEVQPVIDDVRAALDAAHRAGMVHGAVNARNVLVDEGGRGFLTDFGLESPGATMESDREQFDALERQALQRAQSPRRPRRAVLALLAGIVLTAAVAAVILATRGGTASTPGPLRGAEALGSALPAAGVVSADCSGRPPSGASEPCTLVQTRLDGRPLAVRANGVVRRWSVRGARGELALQVMRRRGALVYRVARSPYELIRDERLHVLTANLPVRKGDLVGLAVAPGSAVGVRRAGGATTQRQFGVNDLAAARFDHAGTERDQEVLLRVEYVPGARWRPADLLTGAGAAAAPDGRKLDALDLGGGLKVAAVSLGDRIVLDLRLGEQRIGRLPFDGADPKGRLGSLVTSEFRFGRPIVRMVWRNPSGIVTHDYSVGMHSAAPID